MNIETIKLFMSNAYLIDWESGLALVDAGLPSDRTRILRALRGRERELQAILITHAHIDHSGAAAAVRAATGAPVAIHQEDADSLRRGRSTLGTGRSLGKLMAAMAGLLTRLAQAAPCEPDFILEDGALLHHLGIPARVLHTAGHTPGSCSFLFNRGYLFAGDLISGSGRPHPQRYLAQDWDVLPDSLRRVQAVRPEWIYPGHGPGPIPGSALAVLIREAEAATTV